MANIKKTAVTTAAPKTAYITNFGEARRFILDVMVDLRNGDIPVDRGLAIATVRWFLFRKHINEQN